MTVSAGLETIHGYRGLIDVNDRNVVFDTGYHAKALDLRRDTLFELAPETVVDKETLQLVELDNLHAAIDYTTTMIGSATLYRSLIDPPNDITLIRAKQESAQELAQNPLMRSAVSEYLQAVARGELALFKFLNRHNLGLSLYEDIRAAFKSGRQMRNHIDSIPQPETEYLKSLISQATNFEDSPVYQLMRGPIYQTPHGLRSSEGIGRFTPKLKFRASNWTSIPGYTSGAAYLTAVFERYAVAKGYLPGPGHFSEMDESSLKMLFGIWFFGYGMYVKPILDTNLVINPIRDKTIDDDGFIDVVDTVGRLDELLSFAKYAEMAPYDTVYPEIINTDKHHFVAENLRNPILAKDDTDYVANDVDLTGERPVFVSGPNSGGKSTLCKTIVQTQLQAQIGAPIAATTATISVADRIAYQAPRFDALSDPEGRFGTDQIRAGKIFYSVTPQSLVVLDELAEGTTTEERMVRSQELVNGFSDVDCTTLIVTHNHELCDLYSSQGKGQFIMFEFEGDKPTHRALEGVSHVSHAEQIVERIGFSAEDIDKHLREHGYRD